MSDWTERNRAFSNAMVDVQTAYIDAEIATRELQDENAKLRELFAEVWPIAEYAGDERELRRAHELLRELGMEAGE